MDPSPGRHLQWQPATAQTPTKHDPSASMAQTPARPKHRASDQHGPGTHLRPPRGQHGPDTSTAQTPPSDQHGPDTNQTTPSKPGSGCGHAGVWAVLASGWYLVSGPCCHLCGAWLVSGPCWGLGRVGVSTASGWCLGRAGVWAVFSPALGVFSFCSPLLILQRVGGIYISRWPSVGLLWTSTHCATRSAIGPRSEITLNGSMRLCNQLQAGATNISWVNKQQKLHQRCTLDSNAGAKIPTEDITGYSQRPRELERY
jgi:hypothetical protein